MVMSWILNSFREEIDGVIYHHDMAAGMWKSLKERFSQVNLVHEIKKEIVNGRQGDMLKCETFGSTLQVSHKHTKMIEWDVLAG